MKIPKWLSPDYGVVIEGPVQLEECGEVFKEGEI